MNKRHRYGRARPAADAAAGLGAAGGLVLPGLGLMPARRGGGASSAPARPASAADSVFIGITTPLTGPYSADGKDEQLGYELAIAEINAGSADRAEMGPQGQGRAGQDRSTTGSPNSETKPNVAVQAQTQFIQTRQGDHDHRLRQQRHGDRAGGTGAAREGAEHGRRCPAPTTPPARTASVTASARSPRPTWRARRSAPVVAQGAAGTARRRPTWCRTTAMATRCSTASPQSVKPYGWTVATQQVVPLRHTGLQLRAAQHRQFSGADVFVNIAFGADAVASTKQADAVRRAEEDEAGGAQHLLVPGARRSGAALMQGVYGTFDFWWTLEDRYPAGQGLRAGVPGEEQLPPALGRPYRLHADAALGACRWSAPKTFYPAEVIKALEASKIRSVRQHRSARCGTAPRTTSLSARCRSCSARRPAAMKNPDDFFDVVEVVPGEQADAADRRDRLPLGGYS